MKALALLALLMLAGCESLQRRPDVVIRETVPLPEWATAPLRKPRPVDGTVGALGASHDARGAVIDYADCRSLLIRRIEAGHRIERDECAESLDRDPR